MGVDMIGSAEEARFIHDWWHRLHPEGRALDEANTPDGWEYLGSGAFRAAYLAPSGVVYKVQQDLSGDEWQTNQKEWETWKRLYLTCKMPKRSRLPKMGYWPISANGKLGVIAVELLNEGYRTYSTYVDEGGKEAYWGDVLLDVRDATGLLDLYGTNVMIDRENQVLVPTDLGAGSEY
jgi:hypothetical protein